MALQCNLFHLTYQFLVTLRFMYLVTFTEGANSDTSYQPSNNNKENQTNPNFVDKKYPETKGNRLWSEVKLSDTPVELRKSYTLILDILNRNKNKSRNIQRQYGKGNFSSTPHPLFHIQNHTNYELNKQAVVNLHSKIPQATVPVENQDLIERPGSSSFADLVTVAVTVDESVLHQYENSSVSLLDKMIAWKSAEKRKLYSLKASPLWIGVGAGICSSVIVMMIASLVCQLLSKRRSRCSKLKEMSIGTPKEEKPIYIKLSQLHRPKHSPNYVVTVLDESNFSINSDDSSEEELFDLSAISTGNPFKTNKNNNNIFDHQNLTSTPKKENGSLP